MRKKRDKELTGIHWIRGTSFTKSRSKRPFVVSFVPLMILDECEEIPVPHLHLCQVKCYQRLPAEGYYHDHLIHFEQLYGCSRIPEAMAFFEEIKEDFPNFIDPLLMEEFL